MLLGFIVGIVLSIIVAIVVRVITNAIATAAATAFTKTFIRQQGAGSGLLPSARFTEVDRSLWGPAVDVVTLGLPVGIPVTLKKGLVIKYWTTCDATGRKTTHFEVFLLVRAEGKNVLNGKVQVNKHLETIHSGSFPSDLPVAPEPRDPVESDFSDMDLGQFVE